VTKLSYILAMTLTLISTRAGDPPPSQESNTTPASSTDRPLAPRLVDDLAGRVEDRKPLPEGNPSDPPEEYKAYCLTLLTAKTNSVEAFANRARHGVAYVDLFE
jgi:hypothetical protein